MAFVPSAHFKGPQPGYAFKRGEHGLGYYADDGRPGGGGRPPRGGSSVNFLADLEAVEARDVASPGFRPPRLDQRQAPPRASMPEWARVEQEGLTEARISYGAHQLPGNGIYAGQQVSQHNNGLGAGGMMEGRRHQIHTSQISFTDIEAQAPNNQRWQTSSSIYQRGGGVPGNAAAHVMPPAGGRSNLAGPSSRYGTQNPASLTSVF